ncbi:MAG TPA: PspA/IM30 family protein [Alphaproteobacteria bacterium]|nr:PspA/IM30 family protein [Alphaproteobacteria bacterium]
MAESIFVRVRRVVAGGVGSALDTAERLGGTSVMRQAIRDLDAAVDRARAEGDAARTRRLQAGRQLQLCRKQLATLKEQARFALARDRADLAEAAIARQLDVESRIAALAKAEADAQAEESRLTQSAAELKLRRGHMDDELRAFEAAQRASALAGEGPGSADSRLKRRAERAEEAFERALAAAGGTAGTSPGTAAKVAELEALQKEAAIAERLAALRGGGGAAAPKKRRPAKPTR